jgi:hypothetical protein
MLFYQRELIQPVKVGKPDARLQMPGSESHQTAQLASACFFARLTSRGQLGSDLLKTAL